MAQVPDRLPERSHPDGSNRPKIDGLQFAREGLSLEGCIDGEHLERLGELGVPSTGAWYRLTGHRAASGHPALLLAVRVEVELVCQRCLEPLVQVVDREVDLELSEDQRAIDAAADDIDRVLATASMDVIDMVEDEILLGLPMVARHPACEPPAADDASDGEAVGPLAALARFRKS